MGGASSSELSSDELDTYAELTFLKKNEIIRAFTLFRGLDQQNSDVDWRVRLPCELIRNGVPEIKCNPFGDRILAMFSSEDDDCLSFEDFLDMLSVFNRSAPDTLKANYAFRLYDVDGDSALGRTDLSYLIDNITRTQTSSMPNEEKATIIDKVLEEADIDRDGAISLQEFQHLVSRCPDFVQAFSFEIV